MLHLKNEPIKQAFNFEIYTKNPLTGETGWEIKFITVFAYDKKEARELLKIVPNFDCVILFNYCRNLQNQELKLLGENPNCFYLFTKY